MIFICCFSCFYRVSFTYLDTSFLPTIIYIIPMCNLPGSTISKSHLNQPRNRAKEMYPRNLPMRAAYKVLKVPPDSVPPDSLAVCPFCSLLSQTQRAAFFNFASAPRKPLSSSSKFFYAAVKIMNFNIMLAIHFLEHNR